MYSKVLTKIKRYSTIVLFGHVFPDGDCYGSQVGLKALIQQNFPKKKVFVIGSGYPNVFDLIGTPDRVSDDVLRGALAICLDTADVQRLEDPRASLCAERIQIDHHVPDGNFPGERFVDTNKVATAHIIADMAFALKWKVPLNAAYALAIGIITDSNRFLYPSEDGGLFGIFSRLLSYGISLKAIYQRLYTTDVPSLAIKGFVYGHFQTHASGILYCVFGRDDLKKLNITPQKALQQINLLSSVAGHSVWAMFAEDQQHVHVELRSSEIDVQTIAIRYGGGGHVKASGFRMASLKEIPTILKDLNTALENHRIEELKRKLQVAKEAAALATKAIMAIYRTDFDYVLKADQSPVTLADEQSDAIIRKTIARYYPDDAFLTEESKDDLSRLDRSNVWIVDPIDGTKDFIAKNDEFTINIALVIDHEVQIALVVIPAKHESYYALKGQGAFHETSQGITRIRVSSKLSNLTALTSRFHTREEERATIQKHADRITAVQTFGSSIKACRIAEGLAELSYRFSDGTNEWDTAASQLIVEEAGGLFIKPDGTRYQYNRADVKNRQGYIIVNRKENILL